MKKNKTRLFVTIIVLFVILIFRFGIQIGDVRIGKQLDLKVPQNENFMESEFNKLFYSEEDLIVLNIWATWCIPCIEEIPQLNRVRNKYKDNSIHFLSLSIDKDSVRLQKFLDTKKFKFKDITIDNLEFRDAILNTLENVPTDKWISSYSIPITYIIKNKKVVNKIKGQIDENELITFINKQEK